MIENKGAISGTITHGYVPKTSLSEAEIEQYYFEFFNITRTYTNSKRRKDFVNFAKAILEKEQKK